MVPRGVPAGRDHPAKGSALFGHKQSTRDSSDERLEKACSDPDPFSLLVMLVSLPNLRISNVVSGLTTFVSLLIPGRSAHIRRRDTALLHENREIDPHAKKIFSTAKGSSTNLGQDFTQFALEFPASLIEDCDSLRSTRRAFGRYMTSIASRRHPHHAPK
jgi:hypothetical protein